MAILTLTSGSVARGDGGSADIEDGGNVDVVPFFLLEGVHAKYKKDQYLTSDGKLEAAELSTLTEGVSWASGGQVAGVLTPSSFVPSF